MPETLEFSQELRYYVHATAECIPLLERCSQNCVGPVFDRGILEQILAGKFKCFRVDWEAMHAYEYTIFYQGRDLDRVMREFTTMETSRLYASSNGKDWKRIGSWVRSAATWGSSMEHAYGRQGADE